MAEDIDIEEHDVLDNPVIRNIFPDISVIKKEISQYYEDVPNIKQEPETCTISEKASGDPDIYTNADKVKQVHKKSSSENEASKLLVGFENKQGKPFPGTKIILGSKPNKIEKPTQDEEFNANENQNISLQSVVRIPKLLLQDLGEYIYQSKRYCQDCKTLFPSKSDFHDHKIKSHIVKMQNKLRNVTQKSNAVDKKNQCNICGYCFSFRAGLNRHYKNIHKKENMKIDNSVNNVSFVASINDTHHAPNLINHKHAMNTRKKHLNLKFVEDVTKYSKEVDTPSYIVKEAQRSTAINNNKCTICGSFFSNRANLNRHYKNIHKKRVSLKFKYNNASSSHTMVSMNKATRSQNQKTKPNAKHACFHCDEQFLDQKCLIEHIYEILEPKQKRGKILSLVDKEYNPSAKTYKKRGNTITERIRMKDKLIFENPNSGESEPTSSESETDQMNNDNLEISMKRIKKSIGSAIEKKQTEHTPDDNLSMDQSNFTRLRNKRKHDLSEENAGLIKEAFLDTNRTDEKLPSQSNLSNKKRKLDTKYDFNSKTADQDIVSKMKRVKSKNELYRTIGPYHKKYYLKGAFVYECIICSFLLPSPKSYYMHMFWKHNFKKITQVNKVLFDMQCKFCPSRISKNNRNKHIRMHHNELLTKPYNDNGEDCQWRKKKTRLTNSEFKKVESFVLKSIVYKCTKCDIHFLSSLVAKDHEEHMDLLINWKCLMCKKIFKKHDKFLHLEQHKFSETISVCQFDQSELSRLVYNCTKCGIHFTEERYLKHYSECDYETTDSVYCKNCDILIDKYGYASHEAYHVSRKNTTDIIVITGDIITKNQKQSKCREKLNKPNSERDEKSYNREKKQETEAVRFEAPHNSQMYCLTFCRSCKCYLSDVAIYRKSHVLGCCSKMVKYTCTMCGLVFTNKTINTHRDHHKKEKGLTLQDFEFFDLKGIQIRPPLPEYPSCNNCQIFFVGKSAITYHICSETEYKTCEICNIKLTETAFKLHMNFHNYCMPNEKVEKSLSAVPKKSQQIDVRLKNHIQSLNSSSYANMQNADKSFLQKESQVDKNTATSSLPLGHAILKTNDNSQTVEPIEPHPKKYNLCVTSTVTENERKDLVDNNSESNIILYTCKSCKTSFDTYEKVVNHCQNYFSPNPMIPSSLKICPKCSLKFEIDTYEVHQKLDLCCNLLQVLSFDPTYFTSDNDVWNRHIFASVSLSIQKRAIEKSMYQHECRIKMEVIQQGPSYLTVYKCNRCGIFIDPGCLISHVRDGCIRNMKARHACSVCGLPFISNLSCTEHEKIHKQHDNVRMKSYNIILINSETHSRYNAIILKAMKHYILYQCRTCDRIVEKSQRIDHKCNVDDLQKCSICGLILHIDDIKNHLAIHSDLALYNSTSMKVILFGNDENLVSSKTLSSSFNGLVCDYKLYKCSKCDDCENDNKLIKRHVCTFDDSKWKCPKCRYFISARSIKQHIKMHNVDIEFRTENFLVIDFGFIKPRDTSLNNTKEIHCGNSNGKKSYECKSDSVKEHENTANTSNNSDEKDENTTNTSNHKRDHAGAGHEKDENITNASNDKRNNAGEGHEKYETTVNASSNKKDHAVEGHENTANASNNNRDHSVEEHDNDENTANISYNHYNDESINLYKCACGLHYMDEITAKNHATHCCPKVKIIRQNCSKCSLTFNPKELFAHIIAHHGDKNKMFKYNVIEVKAENV